MHADRRPTFLPRALARWKDAGVTVHGDARRWPRTTADVVPAGRADEFDGEYLSLDLAAQVVDDLDAAIDHIRAHTPPGTPRPSSPRTCAPPSRFTAEVDAAAVLVNASSRFVDGGEFGFGAEIGISTQKLHARGPMALPEMTSTKYVVTGRA